MATVPPPALARQTPVDATPARCLPDALHELIEYEVACAYADGWRAALEAVAAGQVEVGEAWREVGRRGYAQRVAERLALFERCAADGHARYGTRPWDGLDNHAAEVRPIRPEGQQAA